MHELPCGVEELRETLNRIVDLEKDNKRLRKQSVADARAMSHLRGNLIDAMSELLQLKLRYNVKAIKG
jgi:hypothetical protein